MKKAAETKKTSKHQAWVTIFREILYFVPRERRAEFLAAVVKEDEDARVGHRTA
jgi:hypothetical protein